MLVITKMGVFLVGKDQGTVATEVEHSQVGTSSPLENEPPLLQTAPPLPKRVEHHPHSTYHPHTPTPQSRGSFYNNGGRGRNTRGKERGNRDNSSHYESYTRDFSPRRRNTSQNDYHHHQSYPQRTPVHTHNRFLPLREDRSRDYHNSHYTYKSRDNGYQNRSPFNYNQTLPRPRNMGGFHRESEDYQRNPDQNVAPEGGAAPGKRKRT